MGTSEHENSKSGSSDVQSADSGKGVQAEQEDWAQADRADHSTALPEDIQIYDDDSDRDVTAKLRAQGVRLGRGMKSPTVFWPALVVIVVVSATAIIFPSFADAVLSTVQEWIVEHLGWYYLLTVGAFIIFAVAVGASKYGRIRLGRPGERPEFAWLSWFAMLFAAGMGVGLVFFGVAEPLSFLTTETRPGWSGDDTEIAQLSMAQTFIHWGLHPWAVYAVIGLAIAYAIHRRGRPVSIRWAFEPLLGERVKGWIGDVIDVLAIFGTIFGIATSLGLGAQQIGAGLEEIGIVETADNVVLIILVIVITFIALASLLTGLSRGIKWLSNFNMSLAGVLLITVLLLGPTLFLFQNMVESFGVYLANVLNMTFDVGAYTGQEGQDWASTWTLFYWGWWISWAPFVGVFIARISRGRTVREFIAGVLLVPTVIGILWFSVLGGSAIYQQLFTEDPLVAADAEEVAPEPALFDLLATLPWGGIISVAAIVLIATFFITSSDSGSLVIDMLASGGHPNPPIWSRTLFALLEGALAIGLLLAGGLEALQAASLITALPFSVVLLVMMVATLRVLRADHAQYQRDLRIAEYKQLSGQLVEELADDFDETFGEQVDSRVDTRIDYRLTRTRGVFDRRSGRRRTD